MGYKKELGAEWYIPMAKKAFTKSTVATSKLIEMLAEEYLTVEDVYNAINYDPEAKEIVKYFIDKGYKNYVFRDFFRVRPTYRKIENGEIITIKQEELKKHLDKIPTKIQEEYNDYEY